MLRNMMSRSFSTATRNATLMQSQNATLKYKVDEFSTFIMRPPATNLSFLQKSNVTSNMIHHVISWNPLSWSTLFDLTSLLGL